MSFSALRAYIATQTASGIEYRPHPIGQILTADALAEAKGLVFGTVKTDVRDGKRRQYFLYVCDNLSARDKRSLEGKGLREPGNRIERLLRVARNVVRPGEAWVEVGERRRKGEVVAEAASSRVPVKFSKRTLRILEDGGTFKMADTGVDRITVVISLPNDRVLGVSFFSRIASPGETLTANDIIRRILRQIQHAPEFGILTQVERVVSGVEPTYEGEKRLSVAAPNATVDVKMRVVVYPDDPAQGTTPLADVLATIPISLAPDSVSIVAGNPTLSIKDVRIDQVFSEYAEGVAAALFESPERRRQIEVAFTSSIQHGLGRDLWEDLLVGIYSGMVSDGLRDSIAELFQQWAAAAYYLSITSAAWRFDGAQQQAA